MISKQNFSKKQLCLVFTIDCKLKALTTEHKFKLFFYTTMSV